MALSGVTEVGGAQTKHVKHISCMDELFQMQFHIFSCGAGGKKMSMVCQVSMEGGRVGGR